MSNFEKKPTAQPKTIVVTITMGKPVGSSLYIKKAIGKTNKTDTIMPLRKETDTKFILGINSPKTIHTKKAEMIKNLSIFLIIIGAVSILAATKPMSKENR
jgi:hypothetical protein